MQSLAEKIHIFYDGTNINKYASLPYVSGFTTNTSFMALANETNYSEFYQKHHESVRERPLSLQIFSDLDDDIFKDAMKVASYGDNIYVKIPIQKSTGETNLPIIQRLLMNGIKINITAIFTYQQIISLYSILENNNTPVIVSIFAGRISDTGINPFEIIKFASNLFKHLSSVQLLWAGCKEVLSIQHAIDAGCHIITIPDSIMDRLNRIYKNLTEFSLETVQSFQKDALQTNILI